MPAKQSPALETYPVKRQPHVSAAVLYRTRAGVDIAALVTAVIDQEGAVHVEQFPPPGIAKDVLSYQWGVAHADGDPRPGTWRWPEEA